MRTKRPRIFFGAGGGRCGTAATGGGAACPNAKNLSNPISPDCHSHSPHPQTAPAAITPRTIAIFSAGLRGAETSATGSDSYIREGPWKLQHPTRKNGGDLELYDLVADPAESKNLAKQHPDIVKKLSAKVEAWVATLPKEYLKTGDKLD